MECFCGHEEDQHENRTGFCKVGTCQCLEFDAWDAELVDEDG